MDKKHIVPLLTAALLALVSCSQPKSSSPLVAESGRLGWPEITRQTKPWTRWWWPGSSFTKADIDTALVQYSKAGLGGMEITTIYGAKGYEDRYISYLSPEWMDLFEYTLKAAEEKDLGIDLANASGWPFGGNWVTPEDACRNIEYKTWKLKGGETLDGKIAMVQEPILRTLGLQADFDHMKYPVVANDNLQQYAFDQVRYPKDLPLIAVTANNTEGGFLDLTPLVKEDGTLDWTAPEGDWTVCALFLGWHGKMVERAGPGGEGDVIDHFSGEATSRYLSKFDEAFKGHDVSTLRLYFNDSYEVDDARGQADWSPEFLKEFKTRRGYDLLPHVIDLIGEGNDPEVGERVVFDYRTTIGELLREKYSVTWQKWAAAQGKGIRNQAHGSPANILDLYSVSDVPETEGRSIIGMKTASSAAHVTDKPLTSAEAATWLDEHFKANLGDAKEAMDIYFLSGVNHIFYHGTCMSPNDAAWPGFLFYAAVHFQPVNPFWADFGALNSYVARCQSFLQAGKPDNDVLLFFDATDLLSARGKEKMLFHMSQTTPAESAIGNTAQALSDLGYSWDYISDRMVAEDIHVSDGKIVTKEGTTYGAIVVPKCGKMLPATLEKLVALAGQGARILVEGSLPKDVPGLADIEGGRARIAKLSAKAQGKMVVSDDTRAMLTSAGIARETMYDMGLQCISRIKEDGGKYYFIKNAGEGEVKGPVPVKGLWGSVGIYNPSTGEYGFTKTSQDGDHTLVDMKLLPGETLLLETFRGTYYGQRYRFYEAGEPVAVTSPWTVRFVSGGPSLPAPRTVAKLGSWTEYGAEYQRFAGSAEYRTILAPVSGVADAWELDLGDVRESAAVWLDGEFLGTAISAPYKVKLTQTQAVNGGELVVRVSNLMANRIAWMDKTGQPWKIFYNANIQARLRENRGPDGFFTAAAWDPAESGLLGPVCIRPLADDLPDYITSNPSNRQNIAAGYPVNYEDTKVGDWAATLPDPLVMQDGTPVKDKAQWAKRRAEIISLFEQHQYGKWPSDAPEPTKVEKTEDIGLDGDAVRKQYRIFFGKDGSEPYVDVLVYLPADAKGPSPLLLNLSFSANNLAFADPGVLQGRVWDRNTKTASPAVRPEGAPARFSMDDTARKFVKAGYGFASLCYTDITPDFQDNGTMGIRGLVRKDGDGEAPDYWGSISAWAWGISKVLDCFEKDKDIDSGRIALTGCSRLGKTTIWAGAKDTRIAAVLPSCSGEGGAALSRRNYGENVAHLNAESRFPYQFCPTYGTYSERVDEMPVDAHLLVALIAPRPLLLQTGTADDWSDPKGEWVSAVEGAPVYRLLGYDLGEDFLDPEEVPAPETPVWHQLSYVMHQGGHGVLPQDWDYYLEFLKRYMP